MPPVGWPWLLRSRRCHLAGAPPLCPVCRRSLRDLEHSESAQRVYVFPCPRRACISRHLDISSGGHPADDLRAKPLAQPLFRDGSCRYTPYRLASTRTATTACGTRSILHLVCIVRMPRARYVQHLEVVLRAHVIVGHPDTAIGVPKVYPRSTPQMMVHLSFSSRGVVSRDCPGRRRVSCGWMSSSDRRSCGGTPSTIATIPFACDSPAVVTLNSLPWLDMD